MKKIICLAMVALSFMDVSATYLELEQETPNAVKQVLELYGHKVDAIDLSYYQRQLELQQINYIELFKQYQSDNYFKATQSVALVDTEYEFDYYARLVDSGRYLDSVVAIGAELETIFAAESEYRMALNEYELYATESVSFDLGSYQMYGTTLEDINKTVDIMQELRTEMMYKSVLPDIGVFENLKSPVVGSFRVTSNFGYRSDPFTGATKYHQGLDLGATTGTEVIALFSGQVLQVGDNGDGYGNRVLISHVDELQTFYCHLDSIDVKKGDYVEQYQKIGEVGSTGRSTGPHLHLGVYVNGKVVDPLLLFS